MPNFNKTLNSNKIYAAFANMIINQYIYANAADGGYTELVDAARIEGSMYGDQALYYAVDAIEVDPWGGDAEANTLLETYRNTNENVQAITLDQFFQIRTTVDSYLSKQAWEDANAFQNFTTVLLGWLNKTRKIYDQTTYNVFVGTEETAIGKQTDSVTINEGDNLGLKVGEKLANILTDMRDVSRDYNDLAYLDSYDPSELKVVYNSNIYNAIKKVDLPVVFHDSEVLGKIDTTVLPERYFGTAPVASSGTVPATNTETSGNIRAAYAERYAVTNQAADKRARQAKDGSWYVYCFAGDLLPAGVEYAAGATYVGDPTIGFKIIHKKFAPYMSGFVVQTSFFNPKSLTETHFLTFGHNTLERLKHLPCVTVRIVEA